MATIQDVVKLSGVSVATVSRVIHNSPNVLPATREKVLAAIRELDYHPNRLAQQFRTQRTKCVLVLLPRLGDSFYSEILKGIEEVASAAGYHIFIANTGNNPEMAKFYYEALIQKQNDGIIDFSACLPREYMEEIAGQNPVVVACRYLSNSNVPNVTIDNLAASREMTEYMLNLGHRRIAYIGGNTELALYRSRLYGYRQALEERGIPAEETIIYTADPDIQGGYDAAMQLLRSGEKFTAIVTSGDTLAVGAIKALQERKLQVPEEIAVCGFDDIEISSLLSPTLTTIRQPRGLIGRHAMEKLLGFISGKDENLSEQIVLPYELVIRASSGKFRNNK